MVPLGIFLKFGEMAQVANFFGVLQRTGDLDDSWLIRIDAEKVSCDRDSVTGWKVPLTLCRVWKGRRILFFFFFFFFEFRGGEFDGKELGGRSDPGVYSRSGVSSGGD